MPRGQLIDLPLEFAAAGKLAARHCTRTPCSRTKTRRASSYPKLGEVLRYLRFVGPYALGGGGVKSAVREFFGFEREQLIALSVVKQLGQRDGGRQSK